MTKPTDLGRARRDRLATDLAERLQRSRQGVVRAGVDEDGRADGVTVDEWRAAGRRAGRLLGWSVGTLAQDGAVLLIDNRRREDLTEAERNLQDLESRAAMERVNRDLLGLNDPPKPT